MGPWLSWAIVDGSQSFSAKSVGMHTLLYTNPNRQAAGDPMYSTDETTFAHDCYGNRITDNKRPWQYVMDPHSTHMASLWSQYVATIAGAFDGIFEDKAAAVTDVSTMPCNFAQSDWNNATTSMQGASGLSVMWNANLSRVNGLPGPSIGLSLNQTAFGGSSEGCYASADSTNPKPRGYAWIAYENTELAMASARMPWLCRGSNASPAATSIDPRIYMMASYFLTYDLGHTVLSEKFTNFSNFDVEPESELVPTGPLVGQPSDVSGLQISAYVYGREYASCYLNGRWIGACAVAVNADAPNYAHPFPWPTKYHHTLSLSGGGILDGGTVSANGAAPPSLIPGDDAVIAIQ